MKNISKKWWQSKLLCFFCDFLNIQKCNFKECPLTWVGSFECVFTHLSWSKQPIVHLFQVLLLLTLIVKNVTKISSWSISLTLTYWNSSILDYLICLFLHFFNSTNHNIHTCQGRGRAHYNIRSWCGNFSWGFETFVNSHHGPMPLEMSFDHSLYPNSPLKKKHEELWIMNKLYDFCFLTIFNIHFFFCNHR
jgi:hypothetical protein